MGGSPRIAGMALAVLLLSACAASSTAVPTGSPPPEPIRAARALADAPDAVHAATTCGELELDQGEELPDDARACIGDALQAREAAALAWSTPTTEGDPIVHFAFVEAGASAVTLHTTTDFDRYGTPGWRIEDCAAIATWGCEDTQGS